MGVLPLPLPLLLLAAGTQASGLQLDGHLDLGRCRFALGMEDGSIPDSRLSASSAWSDSTAARHGRLGRSDGDGAWCPAGPVFPEEEEFLEVDLGRLHVVTLVGTQGRHAGGHGREFARAYRLRYSRDRHRWLRWRDRWGTEVIGGNEDPEGVVLKDLAPPPVARALRVYPRAPRAMSVCLRLELYGCPWDAGLLSYTAPRGQVMALDPAPVVLNDSTYDGYSVGPLQFGGLGQLADGVLGLDDFVRSRERRLWPGYDYVGWRRPPGPRPHVELEFEFEGLRAFRAMQVHCNNMHTRGVSIFGEVECRFKRSLATAWEPTTATHSLAGAVKDPSARSVTVPLGGRQARFIQCHFFFTGEWMLFSEITFLSDVVEEAVGASGWPPVAPPDPSVRVMAVPEDSWHRDMATNLTTLAPGEPKAGQPVAKADHSHTSILIGCLVAIILLLLGVIFLILWRQYWKKILGKAQRRPSEDELRVQLSVPGDTIVINNATGATRGPPRYERIPPSQGEYQEPTRPQPSLPPVPPGAAPLANPAYRLLLATYAQPMGGLARAPPDGAKPINTDGAAVRGGGPPGAAPPLPPPRPAPRAPPAGRRQGSAPRRHQERQAGLPAGGADPGAPAGPQHRAAAGGVRGGRPPLHHHRVHGARRPPSVPGGAPRPRPQPAHPPARGGSDRFGDAVFGGIELRPPGLGHPQLPGGGGVHRQSGRFRYEPSPLRRRLLPGAGPRPAAHPLDGLGMHPHGDLHAGQRRLGFRGDAVGGVDAVPGAALRAPERRAGHRQCRAPLPRPGPPGVPAVPPGLPSGAARGDAALLGPRRRRPPVLRPPAPPAARPHRPRLTSSSSSSPAEPSSRLQPPSSASSSSSLASAFVPPPHTSYTHPPPHPPPHHPPPPSSSPSSSSPAAAFLPPSASFFSLFLLIGFSLHPSSSTVLHLPSPALSSPSSSSSFIPPHPSTSSLLHPPPPPSTSSFIPLVLHPPYNPPSAFIFLLFHFHLLLLHLPRPHSSASSSSSTSFFIFPILLLLHLPTPPSLPPPSPSSSSSSSSFSSTSFSFIFLIILLLHPSPPSSTSFILLLMLRPPPPLPPPSPSSSSSSSTSIFPLLLLFHLLLLHLCPPPPSSSSSSSSFSSISFSFIFLFILYLYLPPPPSLPPPSPSSLSSSSSIFLILFLLLFHLLLLHFPPPPPPSSSSSPNTGSTQHY